MTRSPDRDADSDIERMTDAADCQVPASRPQSRFVTGSEVPRGPPHVGTNIRRSGLPACRRLEIATGLQAALRRMMHRRQSLERYALSDHGRRLVFRFRALEDVE